jgi:hypothetical protein
VISHEALRRMGMLPTFEYQVYIRHPEKAVYQFWGVHRCGSDFQTGDRIYLPKKWRVPTSGMMTLDIDTVEGEKLNATVRPPNPA